MERYKVLDRVGEGTYGIVLRCVHRSTGTLVAIKQFKESKDEERVRRTAARELEVLQTLHHPNLVSFLESFRADGTLHLVFEFMDRTLLQDLEQTKDGLPAEDVESHMLQLLRAVQFLHKHKVMHRDLKPENMLLSENGILKLCDFGFARHLGAPGTKYSDYVATRWYRAPELLLGFTHYGLAVDIWALGCLLVEMIAGEPLFPGGTDIDQLWLIMKHTGSLTRDQMRIVHGNPTLASIRVPALQMRDTLECRFPQLTPKQLQVVQACIQPDPAKRPTCTQLLEFPYLKDAARHMPKSIITAQAASQQKVAAFMARAHALLPAKSHRSRKAINIKASAMAADYGNNAASPVAGRARSQRGTMAFPGPFLSPHAAPFYPRRSLGTEAADEQMARQPSDVSMLDWNASKVVGSKASKSNKQHIGFRMDSLQSTSSGLIGIGHSNQGDGGSTPRSSKRSLLPDLIGEGEQATSGPLVPSSPPKKSRLNKDGRSQDTRIPLQPSGSLLPNQAAMHHDVGHVTVSHAGQNTLLGAESLVSRAPFGTARNSSSGSLRDSDAMAGHQPAARDVGISHGGWEQPAVSSDWRHPPQEPDQYSTDLKSGLSAGHLPEAHTQGPLGWSALPQVHLNATVLPCAQLGQLQESTLIGGQFWDRLDAYNAQMQQQQHQHIRDFQAAVVDPRHASHAHQQGSFLDWTADPAISHVHNDSQGHCPYPGASVAAGTAASAWPVPSRLVIPSQQLPWQPQQQQQIQWPSARDFNPADFHTAAAVIPGQADAVDDNLNYSQSGSPTSSRTTESDASECDDSDQDEHLMWASRLSSEDVDGDWAEQHVPQMQSMSREADDDDNSHRDLLYRCQLNASKQKPV